MKSRLMHPLWRVDTGRGIGGPKEACRREVLGFDALAGRVGPDVLFHCSGQAFGHHTELQARASVLSRPKCQPRGAE